MKKNIYLIIISVVTIACIIFGTYYHTRGLRSDLLNIGNWISVSKSIAESDSDWDMDDDDDGFKFSFKLGKGEDGKDGKDGRTPKSTAVNGNVEEQLAQFNKIDIDGNVMAVKVVPGSGYKVSATYNRSYLEPSIEVKNGTLKIRQNTPKNMRGNNKASVIVYVPNYQKLDDIDIKVNVGEVVVEDFQGKVCEIETNVGEIRLESVDFDTTDVKTNVGEVSIQVPGNIDDYSMDLRTDVGEVVVDGKSYKRSYNSRGSTKKSIDAKTNVGEVNVR